ncbi:hypothetical protein [Streptomyces sp. NPDC093260]|uniref:hypothetical protein n=1 Tax=Streptomyces sp. NPDC093260 TaxID=3155073 RepID=UPI00343F2143
MPRVQAPPPTGKPDATSSTPLRGRPHEPGPDDQIVQAIIDDCTRPVRGAAG